MLVKKAMLCNVLDACSESPRPVLCHPRVTDTCFLGVLQFYSNKEACPCSEPGADSLVHCIRLNRLVGGS